MYGMSVCVDKPTAMFQSVSGGKGKTAEKSSPDLNFVVSIYTVQRKSSQNPVVVYT